MYVCLYVYMYLQDVIEESAVEQEIIEDDEDFSFPQSHNLHSDTLGRLVSVVSSIIPSSIIFFSRPFFLSFSLGPFISFCPEVFKYYCICILVNETVNEEVVETEAITLATADGQIVRVISREQYDK